MSASAQGWILPQSAMLTTCPRSMVDPSSSSRMPPGAPSTNVDRTVPSNTAFQFSAAARSSRVRSTAASAAYAPAAWSRKFAAMTASEAVAKTRAIPSALIKSVAAIAITIAIPSSRRMFIASPPRIQVAW
jgi:hypothetical protein